MLRAGLVVSCAVLAACARDPEEALCPDLDEGDLVVTEIAGPQTGFDAVAPWVELYNASGAPVDLYGLRIRFRRISGAGETAVIVRRSLIAAPGSYTVLGLADDTAREAHVDYGFLSDFRTSFPGASAVDVEACNRRVDLARYDSLPRNGSYSLGANPPDATANDLPANWCTNPSATAAGVAGTPQQANAACP